MDIKYECYYCHGEFPAEDRSGSIERDCRVGFPCPHCGRNIKDDIFNARQGLTDCQKKWLNRFAWIALPFVIATVFDTELQLFGYAVSLSVLLLILFVVSGGLILRFVPCTRQAGVFITKPVEHTE